MSDVRKSLEFAATSSGWSEDNCTRRHTHHFGCSPLARRRSKRAYFKRTVINLFSLVRRSGTKQVSVG
jgi:hypothetical protein